MTQSLIGKFPWSLETCYYLGTCSEPLSSESWCCRAGLGLFAGLSSDRVSVSRTYLMPYQRNCHGMFFLLLLRSGYLGLRSATGNHRKAVQWPTRYRSFQTVHEAPSDAQNLNILLGGKTCCRRSREVLTRADRKLNQKSGGYAEQNTVSQSIPTTHAAQQ